MILLLFILVALVAFAGLALRHRLGAPRRCDRVCTASQPEPERAIVPDAKAPTRGALRAVG